MLVWQQPQPEQSQHGGYEDRRWGTANRAVRFAPVACLLLVLSTGEYHTENARSLTMSHDAFDTVALRGSDNIEDVSRVEKKSSAVHVMGLPSDDEKPGISSPSHSPSKPPSFSPSVVPSASPSAAPSGNPSSSPDAVPTPTTDTFKERACEWDHLDPDPDHGLTNCLSLLKPTLRGKSNWIFLGDSTMSYMAYQLPLQTADGTRDARVFTKQRAGRVHRESRYYGFPETPETSWVPPNRDIEGPVQDEHFQTGCRTCMGFNCTYKDNINNQTLRTEMTPVEYARDVEFPTATTKTSQETVALYLKNTISDAGDTVCVVNAGIHEIMNMRNMTDATYVSNVKEYVRLLHNTSKCGNLVWISINAIWAQDHEYIQEPGQGPNEWVQQNWRVVRWNKGVQAMLEEDYGDVYFVDIFAKSNSTTHKDRIHMNVTEYYQPFARMFSQLMPKLGSDGTIRSDSQAKPERHRFLHHISEPEQGLNL